MEAIASHYKVPLVVFYRAITHSAKQAAAKGGAPGATRRAQEATGKPLLSPASSASAAGAMFVDRGVDGLQGASATSARRSARRQLRGSRGSPVASTGGGGSGGGSGLAIKRRRLFAPPPPLSLVGTVNLATLWLGAVAEAARLPPIESVAEQAAPLLPLSMEEIHVGRILGDGADGPVESKCHTPTAELSESGGGSTEEAAAALSVAAQAAEKVAQEVAAEAKGAGTEEPAEAAPEAAEAAAAADVGVSKMDVDLLLKYQRDGVEESVTLITYDYGGQRVFYALHHLFLTRFGVYLCCFDMRKMVDTGATEAVVVDGKKTGERRPIYDPAGCLSFLRFWLASIYEHARDAQGQSATVLLIGTHGDHVKTAEQHKAISDQLLDTFGIENAANGDGMLIRSLEFSDDELCFWPLDNTQVSARSGDISVPCQSSVGSAADCSATPYPLLSLPPPAQRRPTC